MATQTLPLQERDPNTASAQPSDATEKLSKSKPQSTNKSKQSKDNKPPSAAELSHIHLEGEEDEKVAIFDTCSDVRTKITNHLKGPTNQTAFCRELSELTPHNSVNQRQLARFLKFKGPRGGAHSQVFYSAYVYFEKLRLYHGKAKGKKRETLEDLWSSEGGFPREGSHNMALNLPEGDRWSLDQYGQVQIHEAQRKKAMPDLT